MGMHLVTEGSERQSIVGFEDPAAREAADGSVIFQDSGSARLSGRPYMQRVDGEWQMIQPEVAMAWYELPAGVRDKLIADPDSPLDQGMFDALASSRAPLVTSYWVASGEPSEWRVGGGLRDFVEVLHDLDA